MHARRGVLLLLLPIATAIVVTGCPNKEPPPTSEPPPQSVSVIHAPDAKLDAQTRKGTGWYPNVEVDADNRLHVAWVDADVGDVLYAFSAKGGGALAEESAKPQPIDTQGAVGSFLRLALAPGGAPLFSYARQDESVLRVAWRAADRQKLKDAGADVDLAQLPPLLTSSKSGSPIMGAAGVVVEEIGFGDQVGRGSSLVVDDKGRFALAYYAADDRLRLARRPADVPAFGTVSLGVLEKRDLDAAAASSIRVQSDAVFLADGTLVVSYAHDVVTDARLRVAVVKKDAAPVVVVDEDGAAIAVDGLVSGVHVRADGDVDVTRVDVSEKAAFVRTLGLSPPAWQGPREKLFDVDGPAVVERKLSNDGWYGLARVKSDDKGEGGGVYLYVVDELAKDGKVARSVRRIRLDGGGDLDPSQKGNAWVDLVVRPDGRPAAVWYDPVSASLKLYAP